MPTINEYVDQLKSDRVDLVDNLETQGITGLTGDETFTQLVPRVLDISTGGGQIIQYDTMPIASSEYAERIVQYIGATTNDYTNGYFYKCQGDGTAIPQYDWVRIDVQPIIPPKSYTYTGTTMTVNNLTGNWALKANEITTFTVNNVTASDLETIIYFTSGTTATTVSIPVIITNIGDAPTFTVSGGKNTGTCEASKHYIISVINNIAVWKAY